ncbi:MAG: LemA protein [Candidatus Thalassarchaeaceae archaeon]|jgi:LemA protein
MMTLFQIMMEDALSILLLTSACFIGTISGLVFLWAYSTYNRLTGLNLQVEKGEDNIDTILQERFDLIEDAVDMAKGQLDHEKEIWKSFARARGDREQSKGMPGRNYDMPKLSEANGILAGATMSIRGVIEQYPDLDAIVAIEDILRKLERIEQELADVRQIHNEYVFTYNVNIMSFPALFIAKLASFSRAEGFSVVDKQVRAGPEIRL